jgi:hypothetical protein
MRIVYVDNNFKCHPTNDGTMTAVEDAFFDGKCDAFIAGYCYDDSNGYAQIYPWKPYGELERVQREYERHLLAEYEAALAEIEKALGV